MRIVDDDGIRIVGNDVVGASLGLPCRGENRVSQLRSTHPGEGLLHERRRTAYVRRRHRRSGERHRAVGRTGRGAHDVGARRGNRPEPGEKPHVGPLDDRCVRVHELALLKEMIGLDVDDVQNMAVVRRVAHLIKNRIARRESGLIARGKDKKLVLFYGARENPVEGLGLLRNIPVRPQTPHPAPGVAVDLDVVKGLERLEIKLNGLLDRRLRLQAR